MTGNRLPIQLPVRRAYRKDLCCTLGLMWIHWGWPGQITQRPLLCRGRLPCPSPFICPLQIELFLDSALNNSLNEEIIIIKKSYRDTVPLAFHVSLEVNWASPAQHVESKNGICSFALSKTVQLMALPPHGHKYSSQKHMTAPEFISQQAPGNTILWSWLWLQLVEAWPICSIGSRISSKRVSRLPGSDFSVASFTRFIFLHFSGIGGDEWVCLEHWACSVLLVMKGVQKKKKETKQ